MPENLFRQSNIDIREVVERPEILGEFNFNPEKYLEPEDWDALVEACNRNRSVGGMIASSNDAVPLVILYPDRRHELGLDEQYWQDLKRELESEIEEFIDTYDNEHYIVGALIAARWVFPDRIHEIFIPQQFIDKVYEFILDQVDPVDVDNLISVLELYAIILCPILNIEMPPYDQMPFSNLKAISATLKEDYDREDEREISSGPLGFFRVEYFAYLAKLYVVDQGLREVVKLGQADLSICIDQLNWLREQRSLSDTNNKVVLTEEFANLATAIRLLSLDKIKVDRDSIQLVPRSDGEISQASSDLPNVRKY